MSLLLVGLNHQTAPVAIREQVAFSPEQILAALPRLRQMTHAAEALILSTCNRTEIYTVGIASDVVLAWWMAEQSLSLEALKPHLYFHHDAAVVKHLARVASGLDSMILGEPQVFGQVKAAYHLAQGVSGLGSQLQRLCQHSFHVSKKIRSETLIGQKPVSIAFTAVSLVRRIFANPAECKVLLLGAGETIALVAQHLAEMRIKRFVFANRSLDRAAELAKRWQGEAFELSEIDSVLAEVDIIVAATDSPKVLLPAASLAAARRSHRRKPLLLIDLAVPRNIDPLVAELTDCYSYCLDDLQQLIQTTLLSRRDAAVQAEAIIDVETMNFYKKSQQMAKASHIRAWQQKSNVCRDQLLSEALRRLANGVCAEDVVQQLAHRLTQQLQHIPIQLLRDGES